MLLLREAADEAGAERQPLEAHHLGNVVGREGFEVEHRTGA
jgi:hypothetical protein